MEKKQISRSGETRVGRRMRAGSGEDDAARAHQPGEDEQDGEGHAVWSPQLKPA
jgi:hypothetical protein